MSADIRDCVRRRAYEIWLRDNRPYGRSDEHWRQAQAELRAESDAEKALLEAEEIRARLGTYESLKEKRTKFIVSAGTPAIAAAIALTAAYIELRSVQDERAALARQQATTEQTRRIAVIRDNLLGHPHPSIRRSAAAELTTMDPQLSEGTIPRLGDIAATDDSTVADAAMSTLIAWRTQLAAQSLTALASNTVGTRRYAALEALANFQNEHGFRALIGFIGSSDPRLSGRAKVLLALAYRESLIEEAVSALRQSGSNRSRGLLDALILLSGEDVSAALFRIQSELLAAGSNDKNLERVLCLHIGKRIAPLDQQLQAFLYEPDVSTSHKLIIAAALMGTNYNDEAASLLLTSPWTASPVDWTIAETRTQLTHLLEQSGFSELARQIAYDDALNGGYAAHYFPFLLTQATLSIDQLKLLIDGLDLKSDQYKFSEAAKLLIAVDRPYTLDKVREWTLAPANEIEILSSSSLNADKRLAIEKWFDLILDRLSGNATDIPALPEGAKLALTAADADRIADIFLDNPPPPTIHSGFWSRVGINALLGTDFETRAIERLQSLLEGGELTPLGYYYRLQLSLEKSWGNSLLAEMKSADPGIFSAVYGVDAAKFERGLWVSMLELMALSALVGRADEAQRIYTDWFDSLERIPSFGEDDGVSLSLGAGSSIYVTRPSSVGKFMASAYPKLASRWITAGCNNNSVSDDLALHEILIGINGIVNSTYSYEDQ